MTLFIKNSHSVLFLHVPKCGGSSIDKLFKNNGYFAILEMRGIPPQDCLVAPQHQTSANLKSMINIKKLKDSFIVVRNPYERIVSEYNWQFKDTEACKKPDINDWIIKSLKKATTDPNDSDNHFRTCIDFIDIDVPCNIFKLEDGLEFVVEFFLREQGSIDEIQIPIEKGAKYFTHNIYKPELSSVAMEAINEFYKDDFKAFDYKPYGKLETTDFLESHSKTKDAETEKKIETIKRWREDTVSRLYQKTITELSLYDAWMKKRSVAIQRVCREKNLRSNEILKLSEDFYDEILFRLKQSEIQLRSPRQSRQETHAGYVYEIIRVINQHRGLARLNR